MLWDKPVNKETYKKLKKVISNIIYNDKQDFHKQAQKLSDEIWELSWGQINLLVQALNIIFEKFSKKEVK